MKEKEFEIWKKLGEKVGRTSAIYEMKEKFEEACMSHDGNPTALQLAAQIALALNEMEREQLYG